MKLVAGADPVANAFRRSPHGGLDCKNRQRRYNTMAHYFRLFCGYSYTETNTFLCFTAFFLIRKYCPFQKLCNTVLVVALRNMICNSFHFVIALEIATAVPASFSIHQSFIISERNTIAQIHADMLYERF